MPNGGIIGPIKAVSTTTLSGIWNLNDQFNYSKVNAWSVTPLPIDLYVDYMLVGGGGTGGVNSAGGGGAGGYLTGTNLGVARGVTYNVVVGAGGAGNTVNWGYSGAKGTSSTFATLVAKRGGGGIVQLFTEAANNYPGQDVASSGGYITIGTWKNEFTSGQGYTGGSGYASSYAKAGGGGGAGGAGQNGTSTKGGNGGIGIQTSFTGATLSICGGGGGCGDSRNNGFGTASYGGTAGTNSGASANAAANSGAGSGGCGYLSSGSNGNPYPGNGGSGRISIRFSNTLTTSTVVVTGSPQYVNSGGYHIYNWTSSGSIVF